MVFFGGEGLKKKGGISGWGGLNGGFCKNSLLF